LGKSSIEMGMNILLKLENDIYQFLFKLEKRLSPLQNTFSKITFPNSALTSNTIELID